MYDRSVTRRAALLGAAAFVVGARGASAGVPAAGPWAPAAAAARRLERLRSLIVAQGGAIRLDHAGRGQALDRPVNIKSLSKTVVAFLTGVAIDKGVLRGVDQTVGEIMPGLIPRTAAAAATDITVEDLLTMRAGLERTSGPNYGAWVASPDWLAYALSRPMTAAPGGPMLYSTGSYHILGAALAHAAGRDLRRLAQSWLGEPLQIDIPAWTRDPQGRFMGGNNMLLSPRALARIGECLRQGGVWRGRRVVSRAWASASLRPRTVSPWSGDAYGYGWFLRRAAGVDLAYGRGYGGQLLYLAPSLDLTVVITSDPTRPARSGGYIDELHALVADHVLPAVAAAQEAPAGRRG